MLKKTINLIFFFFFYFVEMSYSYNAGYSCGFEPYPDVQKVHLESGRKIFSSENTDLIWSFDFQGKLYGKITILQEKEPRLIFEYLDVKQTCSLKSVNPLLVECWIGELNDDNKPDIILVFAGYGCGMASELTDVIFILSKKDKYSFAGIKTIGFGTEDVIHLNNDKKPEIVHSEFIYGKSANNKQSHNYWVYTVLNIHENELCVSQAYPQKWIQYKSHNNHSSAICLSNEDKAKLWNEQHSSFFLKLSDK
ncbi:MAG: hypothetical protein HQM10_25390 [Candidatus Riflebacteria bacterium]|nr:hypothetical protein [Candidatus Riflebacteria bacterium]